MKRLSPEREQSIRSWFNIEPREYIRKQGQELINEIDALRIEVEIYRSDLNTANEKIKRLNELLNAELEKNKRS